MKAMSLFEVIVVLGIFSMTVVLTFPYSLALINRDRANAETKKIAYLLFHEQQDSYAGLDGKSYGIAFFEDRYTVYTGASLSSAETSDTIYLQSPIRISSISLSSGNEISFPVNSFRPVQSGFLIVTDAHSSFKVEVTSEGVITYAPL